MSRLTYRTLAISSVSKEDLEALRKLCMLYWESPNEDCVTKIYKSPTQLFTMYVIPSGSKDGYETNEVHTKFINVVKNMVSILNARWGNPFCIGYLEY